MNKVNEENEVQCELGNDSMIQINNNSLKREAPSRNSTIHNYLCHQKSNSRWAFVEDGV